MSAHNKRPRSSPFLEPELPPGIANLLRKVAAAKRSRATSPGPELPVPEVSPPASCPLRASSSENATHAAITSARTPPCELSDTPLPSAGDDNSPGDPPPFTKHVQAPDSVDPVASSGDGDEHAHPKLVPLETNEPRPVSLEAQVSSSGAGDVADVTATANISEQESTLSGTEILHEPAPATRVSSPSHPEDASNGLTVDHERDPTAPPGTPERELVARETTDRDADDDDGDHRSESLVHADEDGLTVFHLGSDEIYDESTDGVDDEGLPYHELHIRETRSQTEASIRMVYDPTVDTHTLILVAPLNISVDYMVYGFHSVHGIPCAEGRVEIKNPTELNEDEYPDRCLKFFEFPIFGVDDVTVQVDNQGNGLFMVWLEGESVRSFSCAGEGYGEVCQPPYRETA